MVAARVLTDEEVSRIADMYVNQSLNSIKIGKILGISQPLILKTLRKNNIALRDRCKIPSDKAEEIVQQYNQGESWNSLAAKYQVDRISMRSFLVRHGARIRTVQESSRHPAKRARISGEHSPRWKGGRTPLRIAINQMTESRDWRKAVLARDGFKCVLCGRRRRKGDRVILQVDHIQPFSKILDDHKITSLDEARQCKDLWDINNGRTLCFECHIETPTYGTARHAFVRPVRLVSVKGVPDGREYKSILEASKDLNIHVVRINQICRGKRKHGRGHVFEFMTADKVKIKRT